VGSLMVPHRSPPAPGPAPGAAAPDGHTNAHKRPAEGLTTASAAHASPGSDDAKRVKIEDDSTKDGDPFTGTTVIMATGKYKGRRAFVKNRANKKYRVQVEGVPHGLEFFAKAFLPIGKDQQQNAAAVNSVEYYHGWSQRHVEGFAS